MPPSVFRNPSDKSFIYSLMEEELDVRYATELYVFTSQGFRHFGYSWYRTKDGPCYAISICVHSGRDLPNVYSTIAAFLTEDDRDRVFELHANFERDYGANCENLVGCYG